MILKASQRGGATALAVHLLNADDNEHIDVHAINGFMATDVHGALQEIEAIACATKCKQPLFSLSLSPPKDAKVSNQDFEDAIDQAMVRTGLAGQPHVVIFHEKHGRRHAHVVVSRIDTDAMKAINLSFFKDRLMEFSRELYITHDWEMPKGHEDRTLTDPLNYSLEEYQVAQRAKRDPQIVKAALQAAWVQSDSKSSFQAALQDAGFALARGDRRGFVAVDAEGNIYSLSRWLEVKTKELKARLGDPDQLRSIREATASFDAVPADHCHDDRTARVSAIESHIQNLTEEKAAAINQHRSDRSALKAKHDKDVANLIRTFSQSQKSLRGLFNLITGNRSQIVATYKAELSALRERHVLSSLALSARQCAAVRSLREDIKRLEQQRDELIGAMVEAQDFDRVRPRDRDALFTAAQIRKKPERILEVLTDTKAAFSKNDIRRALTRFIPNSQDRQTALGVVMASPKLLELDADLFTSTTFHELERNLLARAKSMTNTKAFGVNLAHLRGAIERQNKLLQSSVGANLSDEQCKAIEYVLNRRQLCTVVGYAGAGKSTMLAAANDAWTRQGYRVLGAALAGEAADRLQEASGIPSRTLASWEMSWKNGRNLLRTGDVLVIDEASMVGSTQMSRVIKEVQKQQAKLVLIGDPAQLQSINAGTPLADIIEETGAVRLTEIRRQKVDWQKQASRDLAEGRVSQAMATYKENGAVSQAVSTDDAIVALVEAYMADLEIHGVEKSRIALAQTRADVHAINEAIRWAIKSSGGLFEETRVETDHGPRAFARGDQMVFTRNNHQFGVRNGMIGSISSVNRGQISVALPSGDTKTITLKEFAAVDCAYSVTTHKSQGMTVDTAFILQRQNVNDQLRYVSMTRHKENLHVFTHPVPEAKASRNLNVRSSQQNQEHEMELSL